ncbi:unnamed protein product [Rotaria sordida]|uniref:UBC core domain-containing protein n=1 Tax=Rotaria sordida TaxID=392033 RepID=A0A813XMG9_9BILA|nr:unnamed protein product [Rotaria sordida]CAF0895781.1 unnamed protein product [Rotaria sordida]
MVPSDIVNKWCMSRNQNQTSPVVSPAEPTMTLQKWASAYHFAKSSKLVLQLPSKTNGFTDYYVPASDVENMSKDEIQRYERKRWTSFTQFKTLAVEHSRRNKNISCSPVNNSFSIPRKTYYFVRSLSMPITPKQAWVELSKLKLLGPNGNSPGIFIVDECPFQEEEAAAAAARSGYDFIAGRVLPSAEIYKEGAYRLEMRFSNEYPMKPPLVRFTTPIYHVNVDKDGLVCIPIVMQKERWNATISLADIVKSIVDVIDHPKTDYAMSPEILKEYMENKTEYDSKAKEMVKNKALPRK